MGIFMALFIFGIFVYIFGLGKRPPRAKCWQSTLPKSGGLRSVVQTSKVVGSMFKFLDSDWAHAFVVRTL